MMITSRAPVRIDFAGGWTDVNLFARGAGGLVVNAAIDRYVTGRLEAADAEDWPDPLQAQPAGRTGLSVEYRSDLPAGSGLGTSSALNVVWLSLVRSRIENDADRSRIAELAYQLEEMLGILGGKQDQYAAAYGGFNSMSLGETVEVERLHLSPETVAQLERRLVLCYTGKPRLSGDIHDNVWGAFRRGVPETVNALYALRACAVNVRAALLAGDIETFAALLAENWRHQCALDASVSNPQIEALFATAQRNGSLGGKACGAGGGGCLLFCAAWEREADLARALAQAGAQIIPFRFDTAGLQVTRE